MSEPISAKTVFRHKLLRAGAYVLAMGLLCASIWYALRTQNQVDWQTLLDADPVLLLGLLATTAVSAVLLPGVQFWLITRPFASTVPVPRITMQALIAVSGLFNYTPVKAGLVGRIGYLRHYHGVGYRAALLTHMILGAVFATTCVVTLAATLAFSKIDFWWLGATLPALAVLALIGTPVLRILIPKDLPAAVGSRLLDSFAAVAGYLFSCLLLQATALLAVALRWWLVFRILEKPISLADAWLAAIVHMLAILVGPANGLGLREWLIGVGGQLGWLSGSVQTDLGAGVTAALVDRAVEAIVLIVAGLLGLWFLSRRTRTPGTTGA